MTRRLAALTGAALVLTAGLVTIPPAAACGCGGFATPAGTVAGMDIIGEQAVISLVDGTERVQIGLDAISDAPQAALVIPTPTPAEAALGTSEVFTALQTLAQPQPKEVSVWWPKFGIGWGAGAPDGVGASGVEVFQEVKLGPLEVVSLGSDSLEDLLAWLEQRGFELSSALSEGMQDYVADGWSFVAIKLSPDSAEFDGEIPPVELTFDSDELIYPMRLSAAATTMQRVRTYVVADSRVDRTDVQGEDAELLFAGPLDAQAEPDLADWAEPFGDAAYVTAHEQDFWDPEEEVVADFTFATSSTQGDFHRTYEVEVDRMVGPILAGPAFAIMGGLAAFAVAFVVTRRSRRRLRGVAQP